MTKKEVVGSVVSWLIPIASIVAGTVGALVSLKVTKNRIEELSELTADKVIEKINDDLD